MMPSLGGGGKKPDYKPEEDKNVSKMKINPVASPSDFAKGGRVRKSGFAKVHSGERVLTRKQARKYRGGKR